MVRSILVLLVVLALICASGTASGASSEYTFSNWQGPPLAVRLFVPDDAGPETTLVIVIHGWSREAAGYFSDWEAVARDKGFVLAVPHFPVADFPGANEFNLGHVFDRETMKRRPMESWTFSAVEALFDDVVQRIGGEQQEYTLYGHSAGGQFVHRFLYYMPDSRATRLIAANAGWYTMPDFATPYPYGLKKAGVSKADLATAFGRDLVLLLGREDTDHDDPTLRKSKQARRQGPNRFMRGLTMFSVAKTNALKIDRALEWRVVVVDDAGHNSAAMTPAAAAFID